MNKRILVALVVSSTLLGAILLFLLCVWIYRRRTSKLDDGECRKDLGTFLISLIELFCSFLISMNVVHQLMMLFSLCRFEEVSKSTTMNPISRFNSLRLANFKGSVSMIDYKLLEAATDNFSKSNVLDEGSTGHVYKARFDDKMLAAVKRIDCGGPDAEREFEVYRSFADYFFACSCL